MKTSTSLNWLHEAPCIPVGVTWGVPWAKGELSRNESLELSDQTGKQIAMQSWRTAFWPDGSVKWTAHAAVVQPDQLPSFHLGTGNSAQPDSFISVLETHERVTVQAGRMKCEINRSGSSLIHALFQQDRLIGQNGTLMGLTQERTGIKGIPAILEKPFQSIILKTTIEQQGAIRAVVRIDGRHQFVSDERKWLPFVVRLYFYADQSSIKMTHTFFYDGNPHQDLIKGLGLSFDLPQQGPLYNRHVRFAGDTGFFSESPKLMLIHRATDKSTELYRKQTAGIPIALDEQEDAYILEMLEDSAVWNQYKLAQNSADSYSVFKQTKPECCWIQSASGHRAQGLVCVASENGGLAVGVKNFWQKFPSALEVTDLAKDRAKLNVWFWSPDAPVMDLRHYDTETHLKSSYEGFEEMRSTPYGIANTSELSLWCFSEMPGQTLLKEWVAQTQTPALLVCEPEHYHQSKALGIWSLPDRTSELKAQLETLLEDAISFYQQEIEQRRWYGFWDFGDIMHSYDPVRHTWRYDLGGCAWQNNEVAPNIWLWQMFLRTGRADIFKMAEAMTRHTSEVDVYHFGEYAGLGSRHNVVHWGCGCKEARIAMAGLHRFYYYLTVDERIGDILDEVKDSDYTTVSLDPMRSYYPKDEFPTHTRTGPDWSAFCSNWMTRWERFEDQAYRDKMLVGIEDLKQLPFQLLTGPVFGYDPKTGHLLYMGDENWMHHMIICMGTTQVWLEMTELLHDPQWNQMLADFGAFYYLENEEKNAKTSGAILGKDWKQPMFATGIVAFAAAQKKEEALARKVWRILLEDQVARQPLIGEYIVKDEMVRPMHEIPWVTTNQITQWCINTILCLQLIGEYL